MQIIVGLGSNLGNKCHNILNAIDLMKSALGIKQLVSSKFYISKALTNNAQDIAPDFINAVVSGNTHLAPDKLLIGLQFIEKRLGRILNDKKWSARIIDLDLLLFETLQINMQDLCVPHKEMHIRDFVLEPVCDLCPNLKHPVLCETFYQLKQNTTNSYVTNKFLP
jgi:2-amino-4-hydroxy-6-hydroxymethyldihydropteridine diphosphokinase